MKNFKNIVFDFRSKCGVAITLLAVALMGLSLTACSKDDLGTDQYKGGVSLNVYGPTPVMRGGTLRFLGSNLDQVREVIIPQGISITSIEVVKSGVPSEIRVAIPKDGPVPGLVTLVTNTDQRITTKTELNYIEGIEITSFPASAMPGDKIKIEGDYLNLIYSIAFADDVLVGESDFISHDRYAIELIVPEEAKTGKLELYTADLTVVDKNSVEYQIIQTETAIEIGLPTITSIKGRNTAEAQGEITAKAGETISITGTYFNVVADVTVGGVSVTDLKIANDGKGIIFTLPAEAPDGDIVIKCKSGVEVPVGSFVSVKPTECVATPNPVKAGEALQIDGKDMDLVVDVEFADAKGEYTIAGNQNIINTTQAYAVTVPETATEGTLMLVMANGSRIDVPFTLVKPTITAYNVNPVSAGAALQISGTHLDLIKSITFGGGEVAVEASSITGDGTTITITVPMEGTSGKPVFKLANETSVEGPELSINEAVFCYITAMPEFNDDNTPSAGDTFTVPVKNADKLTKVYVNGTEVRYVYSEKNSTLTFGIPQNAKAKSTLKLESSNGEIEYTISVIPAGSITQVIFEGPFELTWSTSTQGLIPASVFDNIPDGASVTIVFDYTVTGGNPQMKVNNGSWGHIILETGLAPAQETLYPFDPNGHELAIPLTSAAINNLKASATDWGGILIIHGSDAIINKISLLIEIPQETVVWEGKAVADDWGNQPYVLSDGGTELLEAGMKVGSIIRCYLTTTDASWNCQIVDGHWNPNTAFPDCDFSAGSWNLEEHKGAIEFTVTDYIYEHITAKGGWGGSFLLNGDNVICTKVTVE